MPKRIAFRHLETFIAVSHELSISRAAQHLNVAQPAVSQQLQLLESRVGASLFERSARPLKLTEAGRYLQAESVQLLAQFEAVIAETRAIAEGRKGWLGVGFTRSAMYTFLPPVVRTFSEAHPGVELRLHEMLTEDQPEALRSGTIHVGLARDPTEAVDLVQEVLLKESIVAALPRNHRLSRRRSLSLGDLAEEPFILFPKHRSARFPARVAELCKAAGFRPRVVQQTYEIQTALGLVAAGLGITLVTAAVARQSRSDLVFKSFAAGSRPETLLVAMRRAGSAPPLLTSLLQMMRKIAAAV